MGQRHMTYVLVDNGEKGKKRNFALGAWYTQYNIETAQPAKVLRFIKALEMWNNYKVVKDICISDIVNAFPATASIYPFGFIRFFDEMYNYDEHYGMYDEDNNNGWMIIYVEKKDGKFKYTIGCKPGDESYANKWRKNKGYTSILSHVKKSNYIKTSYEDWWNSFTKEEQKLLTKINKTFNAEKIKKIEKQIKDKIAGELYPLPN
jgi:hypothetical protein